MLEKLVQKIGNREAVIGVVGLGYVGLPLVREFARGGAPVLGFDVDAKKVKALEKDIDAFKAQLIQLRRAVDKS